MPQARTSYEPAKARRTLRIAVHDYAGHPFQVQLSRELARRGNDVVHFHCPSYHSGKGALQGTEGDPPTFGTQAVELPGRFEKYSALKRLSQEQKYGRMIAGRIEDFRPDVVLSSNTPLVAQAILLSRCVRAGIKFIFWQQDIYSFGMKRFIEDRLPLVGRIVFEGFVRTERRLLRRSDAVVAISRDFEPTLREWGVPGQKIHIIENWAPLEELPPQPRDNAWAREHDLTDKRVLLYSGTLGLKHNPALLLELALHFRAQPDVRVVVVSEGIGADWLKERATTHGLDNLLILDFQPYARLLEVHATGDVLVVILERDAGVFSVPSKVLSYHCADRPLLAAVPPTNLAAQIVKHAGSGFAIDPDDIVGLVLAAERLLSEPALRHELGRRARDYACEHFEIAAVADRFESVINEVVP